MSPMQILAGIVVIFAIIYAASNQKKAKETFSYSVGFLISVVFIIIVIVYLIPFLWQRTENPLQKNYAPFFSGTQPQDIDLLDFFAPDSSQPDSPLDAYNDPIAASPAATAVTNQIVPLPTIESPAEIGVTQHTVQPGETLGSIAAQYNTTVEKLTTLNYIVNPNNISVGQVLLIDLGGEESGGGAGAEDEAAIEAAPAATPQATAVSVLPPTPEPTAVNLTEYYQVLAALKVSGGDPCPSEYRAVIGQVTGQIGDMRSRECAFVLTNRILQLNPSDEIALSTRDEILAATSRLAAIQQLGNRTEPNIWGLRGFVFAAGSKNEVDSLLRGLQMTIIDFEDVWNGGSWLEAATLTIVSDGWLSGETFQMAVAHATRWGGKQINDTFEVQ